MANEFDCIVIGSGASGLAAALKLKENGQSVCVLEARDRVGGRINHKFGAAFVGTAQRKILSYLKRYNLSLDPVYDEGSSLVELERGNVFDMNGIPRVSVMSLIKLVTLVSTLDHASKQINCEHPLESKHAAFWDSISVKDFLHLLLGDGYEDVKNTLVTSLKPLFGVDITLTDISMLWLLVYIRGAQGLRPLLDVKNGAQEFNVKGTFQSLIDAMVQTLGQDAIRLGQTVKHIQVLKSSNKVVVQTAAGNEFTAQRCIVTIQPTQYDTFTVDCSDESMWNQKLELCKRFKEVDRGYNKIFLTYKEPWWKKSGFRYDWLHTSILMNYGIYI